MFPHRVFSSLLVLLAFAAGTDSAWADPDSAAVARSDIRMYDHEPPEGELIARLERFEADIDPLMAEHHVPGVSLAVISGRELVWARGYGVRCAGTDAEVGPDTVMEACSMSKPFFGYMFLKLVEQGEFELDRPLVEYLEADYLEEDPRHREITARMVLSHTSGLPNWRKGGWRSGNQMSLEFDPGARFRYSGEGFLMLQRAVEKKLGEGLDNLSRKALIEPLGLENSRFVWDDRFLVRASCGHDREGRVKSSRRYAHEANGAYTLYTSAEDYARFLVEVMRSDRSGAHSLSATMCETMLSPESHRKDQQADWGLGWGIRKTDQGRQVYHDGSNGTGFECYSEFCPETGEGVVIMTNAVGGGKLWRRVMEEW